MLFDNNFKFMIYRVSQWQQPTAVDVTDKIKKISDQNDSTTEVSNHDSIKVRLYLLRSSLSIL